MTELRTIIGSEIDEEKIHELEQCKKEIERQCLKFLKLADFECDAFFETMNISTIYWITQNMHQFNPIKKY